jgi:hypothetical protein
VVDTHRRIGHFAGVRGRCTRQRPLTSTAGNPELKNHIFGKSPQYIKQSHRRRLSKPRFARLYQRVMADVAKSEKDYDA